MTQPSLDAHRRALVDLPLTATSLAAIVAENKHLRAQRDELQARMSTLIHEVRSHRTRVMEFRRAFELPVNDGPIRVPATESVQAHLKLVCEEFFELLHAAMSTNDETVSQLCAEENAVMQTISTRDVNVDLPEVADALADLDYVVEGFRQDCGIVAEPVAAAVHESNMRKTGGRLLPSGKFEKPAGWVHPDIAGILRTMGWKD
jgi:predicted HAD superfamily Cof-like phosphohydrolase